MRSVCVVLATVVLGIVSLGCERAPSPPALTPEVQAAIQAEDQAVASAEESQGRSFPRR